VSVAFDADLTACADLVRRADPARFQAAMAAPVAARVVLFPLYAFNVEVARAPWVTSEPMIAEMRLQWWVEALEEIRAGDAVRLHEVVSRLARVLDAEGAALLIDLIEATSGNLIRAATRALGPADDEVLRDAGFALGLANWFRAIPALEAAGRKPLPDGRPEAVRDLAAEGLRRLARARAGRVRVSSAAAPALFPLWETGPVLRAAMRRPASVAEGTLEPAPARSRLGLMLRAMTGRW
jgi:phytoene/squalene synthetase